MGSSPELSALFPARRPLGRSLAALTLCALLALGSACRRQVEPASPAPAKVEPAPATQPAVTAPAAEPKAPPEVPPEPAAAAAPAEPLAPAPTEPPPPDRPPELLPIPQVDRARLAAVFADLWCAQQAQVSPRELHAIYQRHDYPPFEDWHSMWNVAMMDRAWAHSALEQAKAKCPGLVGGAGAEPVAPTMPVEPPAAAAGSEAGAKAPAAGAEGPPPAESPPPAEGAAVPPPAPAEESPAGP